MGGCGNLGSSLAVYIPYSKFCIFCLYYRSLLNMLLAPERCTVLVLL